AAAPVTWPIGMGDRFRGTYHLLDGTLGLVGAPVPERVALDDPALDRLLGAEADKLREDVELVAGAGTAFAPAAYRAGTQTPVLFGTALSGFGVEPLLDLFVEIAPPPLPR